MTIFFTNFVALSYNLIFFADDGWKVDGGMFKEEEGGEKKHFIQWKKWLESSSFFY